MRRIIMIPMFKQPDVPDSNGVIYAKEVFDNYIANHHDPVAVAIEGNSTDAGASCKTIISYTIGYTSVINDKYIIADLLDCNDKETAAIVNKAIGMINEGEIKVWTNFIADLDQTHTYVKEIHNIAYFHLCNNAGDSITIADLQSTQKK